MVIYIWVVIPLVRLPLYDSPGSWLTLDGTGCTFLKIVQQIYLAMWVEIF